jgi:Lipid A 3-O-deacylase (PagL)
VRRAGRAAARVKMTGMSYISAGVLRWASVWALIGSGGSLVRAQENATCKDTRTQLPALLRNAYFGVNLGYLDQPFTQAELQPGFHASSVEVPPLAARVALLGYEFNPLLAAQVAYQRPVTYVTYAGLGGEGADRHHVRVNFGTATLRFKAPLHRGLFAYGEAGLGIVSRTGFQKGDAAVVTDAQYTSMVFGGGLELQVSRAWHLTSGVTRLPGNSRLPQPRTLFASLGFRYVMRPLPPERVEANRCCGYSFPAGLVQVEYSSGVGYGVNNFVSKKVPVFWGGHAEADRGAALHLERNMFHTRKRFALDFGASAGGYRTRRDHHRFFAASVYPLLRFTLVRTKPADLYLAYSMAGPTYISRTVLDGLDTGRHFTFQDFMGLGIFAGRSRNLSLLVKINHYSNGNIFPQNAGVKIPLTFAVGYAFP